MSDCKHGLEEAWCSLCKGDVEVEYQSSRRPCCSPNCKRQADKQVATLPLCERHVLALERRITRVYQITDRRPKIRTSQTFPGWVYFVEIDGLIKIGYSANPARRLESFGLYSLNTTVRLLALERGPRSKEQRLHRQFDEHRVKVRGKSNELFNPHDDVLDYVASGRQCSAFTQSSGNQCTRRALPDLLTCGLHSSDHFDVRDEEVISLFTDRGIPHEIVA